MSHFNKIIIVVVNVAINVLVVLVVLLPYLLSISTDHLLVLLDSLSRPKNGEGNSLIQKEEDFESDIPLIVIVVVTVVVTVVVVTVITVVTFAIFVVNRYNIFINISSFRYLNRGKY